MLFVLPYVSLVQEKIRSLAPFALELGFYLEDYAGSRGRYWVGLNSAGKQALAVFYLEEYAGSRGRYWFGLYSAGNIPTSNGSLFQDSYRAGLYSEARIGLTSNL